MKDSALLPTVLILGGSAGDRDRVARALSEGFDCLHAPSAGEAWGLMSDHFVQVVVCAGDVVGSACADVCAFLREHWPETMFVIISDDPIDLKRDPHIQQILPGQWAQGQLVQAVTAAARTFQLARENDRMALEMRCLAAPRAPKPGPADLGFEGILRAPGSAMAAVIASARQYASFDVPVLLLGETGTGKADLARAIHDSSLRSDQPFHSLDVSGLSEEAVELALFGRRKPGNGSPPVNRAGLVRKADQGTLFLTGIETLSHGLQLRLLRLLRDGVFEIDGGTEPEVSNARLIAATHADPLGLIDQGILDPALYYALSIAELTVPALRNRQSDIPMLAQAVAEAAGQTHGKVVRGISDSAMAFLTTYTWPGNLRELDNEITRMLIQSQDPVLSAEVISRRILQAGPVQEDSTQTGIMESEGSLKDRIEAIEARILRETLTRLGWNKSRSAAELGLSRVGLRAKLDRYGIIQPHPETEEA